MCTVFRVVKKTLQNKCKNTLIQHLSQVQHENIKKCVLAMKYCKGTLQIHKAVYFLYFSIVYTVYKSVYANL